MRVALIVIAIGAVALIIYGCARVIINIGGSDANQKIDLELDSVIGQPQKEEKKK